MNNLTKFSVWLLRVSLGWLFFYAGITKVLNPKWTAEGYLLSAKSLNGFYNWLAGPANIGWVNFLNEWGLTILGVCLILGLGVRWVAATSVVLMVLYYLPILHFPYVGELSFLVDQHVIYILVLLLLIGVKAGRIFGLDALFKSSSEE